MKKLTFCFDGTQNEPEDAQQERKLLGGVEDDNISNILKLHLLLGGDLKSGHVFGDQFNFYYSGVGTYGNWLSRLKNSFKSPENEDVGLIIKRAMKDLFNHYQTGDEIFVFGFSRGAAIARRFISVLNDCYGVFGWKKPPRIKFLGVFDTVAAINKPNLFKEEIKPASDVVFENGTISEQIDKALHLLSLDERRIAFLPTLMNKDKRVIEVWFAGAHSDVGGGYYYDGLSDVTLEFMRDFILNDDELDLQFLDPHNVDFNDLFDKSDELIKFEDIVIHPNPFAKSHEQHAITNIKKQFLTSRSARVNVDDKHSIYAPIIHRSVFDRMVKDSDYQPKALMNLTSQYTGKPTTLKVWEYDGTISNYDSVKEAKESSNLSYRILKIGENATFLIHSNIKYNATGLFFGTENNEAYLFTVNLSQKWYDSSIECGPKGWHGDDESYLKKLVLKYFEKIRRVPEANWFEVIGVIGKNNNNSFRIMEHTENNALFTPSESGELHAFANDIESKYGNNRGFVKVEVKRVR